jgi:tRNA 2-thiouridine synthesizing protein C
VRRDVAVLLTRAPYGRVHVPEEMRAARGVAAGFDRHAVTVVLTADAVYAARNAVDREALDLPGHIAGLDAEDRRMVADRKALAARDVKDTEIAGDIEVVSGEAVARIVQNADHTLDF